MVTVKKVTVSVYGVLLKEWSSSEVQDSARVIPEAILVLKEMCKLVDVYLLSHVKDNVSQAVVSAALEAAGILGNEPGQVRPHRLLFCGTLEGKVAMVRQLEPDMHFDGHPSTVDDLKRFIPQLIHVQAPGAVAAASGAPNVGHTPSLCAFFGL